MITQQIKVSELEFMELSSAHKKGTLRNEMRYKSRRQNPVSVDSIHKQQKFNLSEGTREEESQFLKRNQHEIIIWMELLVCVNKVLLEAKMRSEIGSSRVNDTHLKVWCDPFWVFN